MKFMSIKEMQEREWVISWSGGKDSTATIILCHKYGIPIKRIIYVRMMWSENLPATLPVMTDFVDRAKRVFESWGYPVEIVSSTKTAKSLTEKRYFRSKKYPEKNGNPYGITAFCRLGCKFTGVKQDTIKSLLSGDEYELIGYAIDEVDRIKRLSDRKQSIMCTLGVTEKDAFRICKEVGLLSPLYDMKFSRDGCWFCPNAGVKEREIIRREYPELVDEIKRMIEMCGYDVGYLYARNNWLQDYINGKLEIKDEL